MGPHLKPQTVSSNKDLNINTTIDIFMVKVIILPNTLITV